MASLWILAILLYTCICRIQAEDGTIRFLVLGDWGGKPKKPYYTKSEDDIAEQMGKVASGINANFTIVVGDNFYEDGVTDVDDPRFKETFEDVFTAKSLQSRWYAVAGNHDYHGNVSAQVAYTEKSTRWYMPNYYYTETFSIPGTDAEIQFVFIDTIILCGPTDPIKRWLPPSGPASLNAAEDQWEWIEKTLSTSAAEWLFVVGHYPVWSIGRHGPTEGLKDRLRPMLIKYNVSAYFCGHDHDMQHIHEDNSTVEYFLSGAGHETEDSDDNKANIPPNALKFYYGKKDKDQEHGAFAWLSVSPTVMNVTFMSRKGHNLYSYSASSTRKV
ncbi:tartrate-resistant acid phosphatase type 5-like [Dysidea avara]|uniref:tartrate-resistant acid phosphatase type 5-like n=1 Tax=Dysidea avara TaxID=196820 RepID=UPI00332A76FD